MRDGYYPLYPYLQLTKAELTSFVKTDYIRIMNSIYKKYIDRDSNDIWDDEQLIANFYRFATIDKWNQQTHRLSILINCKTSQLKRIANKSNLDIRGRSHEDIASLLASQSWLQQNSVVNEIANELHIPISSVPSQKKNLASSENIKPLSTPFKSLKNFQLDVVIKAQKAYKIPSQHMLIQMPTGTGKTRTAMDIVCEIINTKNSINSDIRVLWLAHVRELIEQAIDSFKETWIHLGSKPINLYRFYGQYNLPEYLENTCVVFAGQMKANNKLKKNRDVPKFDFIIVDEAHRILSPSYQDIISNFLKLGGRVLGLSATPGRVLKGQQENRRFAKFFNNKIISPNFNTDNIILKLQSQGILSRIRHEILEYPEPIILNKAQVEYVEKHSKYPKDLIESIVSSEKRSDIIFQRLFQLCKESKPKYDSIIVFCGSVDQAIMLSTLMNILDEPSVAISERTTISYRNYSIKQFKDKNIRLLFNYDVFREGFDAPKVDCVFVARPTLSIVLYSQIIGRGLRGRKLGGTDYCKLINVKDNIENLPADIEDIYQFFNEYWKPQSEWEK